MKRLFIFEEPDGQMEVTVAEYHGERDDNPYTWLRFTLKPMHTNDDQMYFDFDVADVEQLQEILNDTQGNL